MALAEDEQRRFRILALPALLALHRLARALCADRSAADDLLQETYLRGLRYFRTYKGGDMRAWLATIMRNLYRSGFGADPPLVDLSMAEAEADHAPTPEQTTLRRHEDAALRHHIAALPDAQREALVLREFSELSYMEIAKIQNVPVGTVMSRLARARASLRESLTP
ncbi:MAG TPA: sigma-70 family RNA polymerase sigma factor [Acidiphilium sp.]|nr:MAG: hypothetical protein B7Z67_01710 [Acidiphilium sp. 21-60-14]OYV91387.1 MAG: hypothetical protein B7Z57_05000 [Acidiphilium sp. 37-60-79]OZB41381.1 MAG: hypothetical protein B7X48_01820 [Acidiphilium sp. 34-60-192]HQT87282.1 sigma-70 family RNA polymerase sigma factor [Acidiphilium sp.]HQU23209.1 sigma-70 family RNA polymerase sigma factor [Acidiphilium sp.]